MAKHVAKASWDGGQMRIAIPKMAVAALKWEEAWYMLLEENEDGTLTIRRFVDGESLKAEGKRRRS